jgi:hypothetical protein
MRLLHDGGTKFIIALQHNSGGIKMLFDFVSVFTSLSKSSREIANKFHDQMIEAWVKVEKTVEDNVKAVSFWKK